jgi:hypothetical protein
MGLLFSSGKRDFCDDRLPCARFNGPANYERAKNAPRSRAADLQPFSLLLQVGEVAYWTTRAVEPFALLAERLAACPLFDVLGRDAVAGLAIAVVMVDLRVGLVPWALAPQGTGSLSHAVRCRTRDPLVFIGGHVFLLTSLASA